MSKHVMLLLLALCPVLSWAEVPPAKAPTSVEAYLFPASAPQTGSDISPASPAPALVLPSLPATAPALVAAAPIAPVAASHSLRQESIGNELRYVLMLGFMCVSSLTIVLYFLKTRQGSAKDMVNAAGLILLIFGTIILVLVVDTSEQLTAAIGVLGAVAGYLFKSAQDNGSAQPVDAPREGTNSKP